MKVSVRNSLAPKNIVRRSKWIDLEDNQGNYHKRLVVYEVHEHKVFHKVNQLQDPEEDLHDDVKTSLLQFFVIELGLLTLNEWKSGHNDEY